MHNAREAGNTVQVNRSDSSGPQGDSEELQRELECELCKGGVVGLLCPQGISSTRKLCQA